MRFQTKAVLIALVLLVISFSVEAGTFEQIEIEFGPNYGFLDFDDPMEIWDPQWDWGYTGGVYLTIPLSSQFSFVPGLRYSHLKNKVEIVNSTIEGNFSMEHNSITLPLLFRYDFLENMFFIDLGPEFAFLLSSKSHSDYHNPIDGYVNETEDISDNVKGYNIEACVRVGFTAYRWNIPLAVNAAYHHGFTGMAEEGEWWSDWTTREFSFSLSYVYQFGK